MVPGLNEEGTGTSFKGHYPKNCALWNAPTCSELTSESPSLSESNGNFGGAMDKSTDNDVVDDFADFSLANVVLIAT